MLAKLQEQLQALLQALGLARNLSRFASVKPSSNACAVSVSVAETRQLSRWASNQASISSRIRSPEKLAKCPPCTVRTGSSRRRARLRA